MTWQVILGSILVPVIIAGGGWWVNRVGRKGDRENALLDQYQEDRESDRRRIDWLEAKVDRLERELIAVLSINGGLRIHIERQNDVIVSLGGTPLDLPANLASETTA